MIRLFVFDLGNVILPFEHRQITVKLHEASRIQDRITPEGMFQYMFDIDKGLVNPYEEGRMTSMEFFGRLRERYKLELEYEEFQDIWNQIFWENPDVNDMILYLKDKGYPIFLLSNTNELHFSYITARYPIVHSLDEWILSYEVGAKKPKQQIFDEIFEKRKDLNRDEVLYIDDIPGYVEAAKGYGLQGFVFKDVKDLWELLKENSI
jgi:glucose-1-phosphatase